MFCAECGSEMKPGVMFCGNCGTPVKTAAAPSPAEMSPVEEATMPIPPVMPPVEEATMPIPPVMPPVEEATMPIPPVMPPVEEATMPIPPVTPPVNNNMGGFNPFADNSAAPVPPVPPVPPVNQVPPVAPPPVPPQGFNPYQQPPQTPPRPQAPAAPKEPVSPMLYVMIAEIALMVILAVGAMFVVKSQSGAKAVAEEYFVRMANADISGALALVDVPASEFINEATYTEYVKSLNLGNVADYSVAENSSTDTMASAVVSYRNNGDMGNNTLPIALVKTGKKNVIFDDYKVLISSAVGSITIDAPVGSTVTIDGTQVPSSYKDAAGSTNVYDHYVVNSIFVGKHKVAMEGDGINPYLGTVEVLSGGSAYVQGSNYFSKASMMEMQSALATYMTEFYAAAAEGKSFSEVSAYFDPAIASSAESFFNSVQADFANRSVEYCRLGDVLVTSYTDKAYGDIQFSYVLTTLKSDGSEKNNGGASGSGYASMTRSNGVWLISDFSWSL